MKKRLLGAVLAAAMMISALPGTVNAMTRSWVGNDDLVPQGWGTSYEKTDGTSWTAEEKANSYVGLTATEAYSGKAAMYFKLGENRPSNGYVRVKINLTEPLLQSATSYSDGKKYRISFYKKGKGWIKTYYNSWKEANTWYHISPNPESGSTSGDDNDKWYLYWRDITVSGGEDYTTLNLLLESDGEYIIDDISIRQYTSDGALDYNKEYVPNGGFEEYTDLSGISDSVDYLGGWSYPSYTSETLWTKEYRDKSYAGITTEDKKSGTASMFVRFAGSKNSDCYVRLINTLAAPLTAGNTYRLSFWKKGFGNTFTYFNSWKENSAGYTAGETVNGWTYYYRDIHPTEAYETLKIYSNGDGTKYLIDDISLREISDGVTGETEYVVNGGFENQFTINPSDRNTAYSWNETYSNVTDKANQYMTVTSADARTGKYSLYSHFENDNASNVYITFRQNVNVEAGKTYVIETWIKGHIFKNDVLAFRDVENGYYVEVPPRAQETVGDWTRYEAEYTAKSTGTAFIGILAQGVQQCYIDDFAMYAKDDAAKTNIISNGSFENVKAVETERLINPICYPVQAGGALNLTWTNPTNANISSIKISVDGTEQEGLTVNTQSDAFNSILIDGLTNGNEYKIKIVSTVDGKEYTDNLSGAPYNMGTYQWLLGYIGNRPSGSWKVHKRDNGSNYANFNVSLDYNEKFDGDCSFRMNANLPETQSNIYPGIEQTVEGLERGRLYQLKFRYKADGVTKIGIDNRTVLAGASNYTVKKTVAPTNGIWQTETVDIMDYDNVYEYDSAEKYRADIYIYSDQMVGTLWIDNVELYEVDSDGDVVDSTNLLKDGGFEYTGTYEIEKPVYSVAAEGEEIPIKNLQGGKIKVTSKIRNFASGDGMGACVIAAVYDGGKLISLDYMEKTMDEIPYYLPAEEYTAEVTVPDEYADCEIKVMYWDGIKTMSPIAAIDSLVYTPES